MVYLWSILAFALWVGRGYGICYFRYQDTESIKKLRENYQETKEELESLKLEHEEISKQNQVLRDSYRELESENDDMNTIVAKLSKYAFRIQKAASKTRELVDILDVQSDDIVQQIHRHMETERENDKEADDGGWSGSVVVEEDQESNESVDPNDDMRERLDKVKKMF